MRNAFLILPDHVIVPHPAQRPQAYLGLPDSLSRKSCSANESRFENCDRLSLRHNIVDVDEDRFDLSCGGRGDWNFHLHGFDQYDIVSVADASAGTCSDRADASGNLGRDLDVSHESFPSLRFEQVCFEQSCPRGFFVVTKDCPG
jgi:hypothetical protein